MPKSEIINIEIIKEKIPHRYPFLLVDRVLEVSSDQIVAQKNVTINEPFFSGHFPKLSVMPGVLQIEAMAQASGLILSLSGGFDPKKEIVFLAGVNKAKFKRPVIPGDILILQAQVIVNKRGVFKVDAKCLVEDEITSCAQITMVVKDL